MITYTVKLWIPGKNVIELTVKDDGLRPGDTMARYRRDQLPGMLYGSVPGYRIMGIVCEV